MSLIQENSYWFIDGEGDNAKMSALCQMCAKRENKGWFWEGKTLGYGNYDLFCASCGNTIHLRENNNEKETETSSKDSRR